MEARAVFDQDRKTATMDDLVPNDALYGAAMDQLLNLPGLSWVKYAPWERHDNYCDKRGRNHGPGGRQQGRGRTARSQALIHVCASVQRQNVGG